TLCLELSLSLTWRPVTGDSWQSLASLLANLSHPTTIQCGRVWCREAASDELIVLTLTPHYLDSLLLNCLGVHVPILSALRARLSYFQEFYCQPEYLKRTQVEAPPDLGDIIAVSGHCRGLQHISSHLVTGHWSDSRTQWGGDCVRAVERRFPFPPRRSPIFVPLLSFHFTASVARYGSPTV
ncbi:hypothetical protein RRG08_008470, partial [Elysia crispata]